MIYGNNLTSNNENGIQLDGESSNNRIFYNLLKSNFQNAFDEIDYYTDYNKMLAIVKIYLLIYREGKKLIKNNINIEYILGEDLKKELISMSYRIPNGNFESLEELKGKVINKLKNYDYT